MNRRLQRSCRAGLGERPLFPGRALRLIGRVVLLGLAVACGSAAPAGGPLRVSDDAGDTVTLQGPAHRVVSLIPATTELLFALQAGPLLVGRTRWCDYPPEVSRVPDLGDGIRPNLEAIVAQHPDLVVLYRSAQNAETAGRLRTLGIPAVQVASDRLADLDRMARLLGRLTGRAPQADSMIDILHRELARVTRAAAGWRPTVLILVWDQPAMTVGRGSFLNELVERAGGTNLFGDVAGSSAQISVEAVAARNPDLILIAGGDTAFAQRPEWRVVPAVRDRRFIRVNSSEFNRPSPRAPRAIQELSVRLGSIALPGRPR